MAKTVEETFPTITGGNTKVHIVARSYNDHRAGNH